MTIFQIKYMEYGVLGFTFEEAMHALFGNLQYLCNLIKPAIIIKVDLY